MIPDEWLDQAVYRLAGRIHRTPVTFDARENLFLKWENHQITGSFKVRGAFNKVLSLQPWELQNGLVTASAGNHGLGVALAAQQVKTSVIVFASEHAVPAKLDALRKMGAEVRLVAGGYGNAERDAKLFASRHQKTWISPYNDGQVIAGQGTLAIELMEQLAPDLGRVWLVPAGGGGLVAGIGAALRRAALRPKLVAVQSEASAFLHALYHRGSQKDVVESESLADGLAGPVESDSLTIPLVRQVVDDFILVTEEEIARAITLAWGLYEERIEGSAAVVLAAALFGKIKDRPAVLVISGRNIQPEVHGRLIIK